MDSKLTPSIVAVSIVGPFLYAAVVALAYSMWRDAISEWRADPGSLRRSFALGSTALALLVTSACVAAPAALLTAWLS